MTGLFVRLLAQAIIDYWHTRRPPQRHHFLHMLAAAFAPALIGLFFSHVRRTKSYATSIMLTGAVLALAGLAVALVRAGPHMGKPAKRRRKRRMHSRAPLKRVRGRGMPAKAKAGA